ncbi:MAG: VWA domain-containing protein [bacterium]
MKGISIRIASASLLACLLALLDPGGTPRGCFAQTASPKPKDAQTPTQQEPIKVYTEEVLLSVIATDSNGRIDPTVELDDLMVLEDGVPQVLKSVQRTPANILFLLDTAGAENPAMKTNATRDLVIRLISHLRPGDRFAALQFGGRAELIQGWTSERETILHSLKTKLSSGSRTRLAEGLVAAVSQMKEAPAGNRHVVLITDGGESSSDNSVLTDAVSRLFAVQTTVHVISYTLLGRKEINKSHPKYPVTITSKKPKSANDLSDEVTRPNEQETLEKKLKTQLFLVVDTDFQIWKHNREYVKTLKENEQWLAWLAEQSGGSMLLPHSTEELPQLTDDLAREIDSQYIVTYRPKASFTLKSVAHLRHVEVVSRRVGLHAHSRRSYIVPAPSQ